MSVHTESERVSERERERERGSDYLLVDRNGANWPFETADDSFVNRLFKDYGRMINVKPFYRFLRAT